VVVAPDPGFERNRGLRDVLVDSLVDVLLDVLIAATGGNGRITP
jgi:hypothetical protein